MPGSAPDPYKTLGVSPAASDAELRAAYHRLVQRHHPDHNGGSAESARKFEAVQAAYAQIREKRQASPPSGRGQSGEKASRTETAGAPFDANIEARLANLERELKAARKARERARRDARDAVRADAVRPEPSERPTDEQLGYIKTDDSFSKILADAASEVAEHLSEAREHQVPKRVSDLIDELAAKLTGEPPAR